MLWTLLILMGSACSLLGSIDAARHPPSPVGGLIVAVYLGTVQAGLNFWAWTRIADSAIDSWVQFTVEKRERALAVVYAVAFLWVPIAGFLSNAVVNAVLSIFRR